jgi:hypothetical protein
LTFAAILLAMLPSLFACDEQAEDRPYFEIAGGGFIFNIRLAETYYGFVLRIKRDLPHGTILQARFEDPAGGPEIVITKIHRTRMRGYKFETPPLQGVKADTDYKVVVQALAAADGQVIASVSKTFRTYTDQDVMPKEALTVGPGYQPNIKTD